MPSPTPPPDPSHRARRGFAAALAAYVAWGLFPLYFKSIRSVPPLEILSHRVVWSMVLLAGLVTWQRRWRELGTVFAGGRLPIYLASTTLISANWLIYIWAVNTGHVLEASLGYFVNPLVNVLLGVIFLREHLTRRQGAAVALAAVGVLALALRLGAFPWLSLALAATFGLYGLVRKKARIDAVVGLLVETALLAPLALAYLLALAGRGAGAFGTGGAAVTCLLAAAGVVTAVPLIWFAIGMKALRLSTMGLIQYITPTSQFLLAVALYREPFTAAHALAFGCIWVSLALYTYEALRGKRPPREEPEPALD
ncbi:EamA family transporter RarD [Anaeromyxobacter diazotrophicus]|uniref:Chloramphenicol resistance permease RarD n=1 Tax=Anaeromyxobacter diazotrophicus TaxID=2590199 RepID=A0A7I9VRL9_9BACT|nr:EamA family transporter RarD [Anaeromyxobacter diazotrophicus]GEJ59076.1 chloramphenicol resistance permease RarD [Anaeromyxobacter diazotrophicus]